jgi:hypothetical protein
MTEVEVMAATGAQGLVRQARPFGPAVVVELAEGLLRGLTLLSEFPWLQSQCVPVCSRGSQTGPGAAKNPSPGTDRPRR